MKTNDSDSLSSSVKFREDLHSYLVGDELLIFDDLTKRLFRNNLTATVIWNGCRSGLSLMEIITAFSEATGVDAERITTDVMGITSHWEEMGLLQVSRESLVEKQPSDPAGELLDDGAYEASEGPVPQFLSDNIGYKFQILDTSFHLSVPTENELRLVKPLLDHLSVSAEADCNESLCIMHTEGRYVLLHGDRVIDSCEHPSGIAPMLHGHSLMMAYELSHCLFGLHAASVLYEGKSVLMPALAGSGKSTLTAALIGSGASLCSDDLVLLTQAPVLMRPVPVAIGLKSGSWDLLTPYFPEIASLLTHLRVDDKRVRYLAPTAAAMVPMSSRPFPVDFIVFPKYLSSSETASLKPISPAEGLCRLTEAGFDIHGEMTAPCVGQLVEWIRHIPCYEIHYSQLDKAVLAIQELAS